MIFKNLHMFDDEFIPNKIIGREKEIYDISSAIRPLFNKMPGQNLFIFGPPGTGKTLCAKHVLTEISKSSKKIYPVYINCWVNRTRPAIMYKIMKSLGDFVPRRGISPDEMIDDLNRTLSDSWGVVIVLDEIDKTEDREILYDILRMLNTNIVLIGISNLNSFEIDIDDRILSTYSPKRIEFKPYSVNEIKKILEERAKYALSPGSYNDDVLGLCAAIGYNAGGDARVALNALLSSAKEAQMNNMEKITTDIVNKVRQELFVRKHVNDLKGLEKKVYDCIGNGKTSSEIHNLFPDVTERTIRNILSKLINKNMLKRIKLNGNRYRYVKR